MNRKDFITTLSGITLIPSVKKITNMPAENKQAEVLYDEDFWTNIRSQFHIDENFIDLRANGASPVPKIVLQNFMTDWQYVEALPSYRNNEHLEHSTSLLREKIAQQINCSSKEIAIMRNTTEALNNAIMGIPLMKDDEVIASVHEYDSMMACLYQRQIKDGITIKQIDIPLTITNTEEVLALWEKAITPKTKMFLISHIVWISGQIYPVKEICALAKKHNILTVVDAAQSFSHIKIDVAEIGCDYLGTSLHKWCAASLGTGFLYIRNELIPKTFPLLSHYIHKPGDDTIEKFENFGTVTPVFKTAIDSIDYWNNLGLELKTKRMHYLKMYWTEKLKQLPNIEMVTNTNEKYSCGMAFFTVKGKSSAQIKDILWKAYKINVAAIENYKNHYVDYAGVNVVGVATPVFITLKELDVFVEKIQKII